MTKVFFKNKPAVAGALIILVMALFALSAPLSGYQPDEVDIGSYLLAPNAQHIMGTDLLGRDLFSRMAYGARISLLVGIVSVGISVAIGIFFGAIAGYYGGKIDMLIMRFVDIMLCFPSIFLILALVALFEPGIMIIMAVIGVTGWMGISRLVRAEILSLKEREFVLAARACGVSNARIITRHLIPNAAGPVLVSATLGVAAAILVESSLSFLGIGVQPPTPSWGNILMDAKASLGAAWWLTLFPGVAIFITVLGYNLLGEGLRDILLPRK
ncbi:MAG: ABC transporter permease [Candidatus Omnitrophica bacterium]|nr:ABC transporter permease [Candidatus Omnitrophota bacterium]MBU4477915.1 ABC transporter permease [Candidatus Omnitrophota bacterium]MCG2703857.1 ABC transporter permease [Candidatus Omnitrophota bacterium]